LSIEALIELIATGVIPLESTGVLTSLNQTAILPIETISNVLSQTAILPYEVISTALRVGAVLSDTVFYHTASTNPGVGDDATVNFQIASLWINTTDNGVFICIDPLPGGAVWVKIGPTV